MQNTNTNPERKSLSELVKSVGEGKIILVEDGYDLSKHIELIEKMKLKHEVVIVHIGDLNIEDANRVQEFISAQNKNPFSYGIAEMLQESTERLLKDMHRLELEIPPLEEKVDPKTVKIHDFGHRNQNKQFNNFKPLPKKTMGFRGKR